MKLFRKGVLPKYSSVTDRPKKVKIFEFDINGIDKDLSIDLSESYYPINSGPIIRPTKPKSIPILDLK